MSIWEKAIAFLLISYVAFAAFSFAFMLFMVFMAGLKQLGWA